MKNIIVLAILGLFLPLSVLAEWYSVNKIDDFTDEAIRFAAYSDNDHRIQLSYQDTSVWMFITRKKIETFEPNGIIELRVDKNGLMIIDPPFPKILGRAIYQWEPSTVGFLLWHGKEDEGCGYVGQLLKGGKLRGRYQVNKMERDTFTISLKGARKAIVDGLDLKIYGH